MSQEIVYEPSSAKDLHQCFAELRLYSEKLKQVPADPLLDVLDRLGQVWQEGGHYHEKSVDLLKGQFSSLAIQLALRNLALSLHRQVIAGEMQRELGRFDLLDSWQPDPVRASLVRGFPLGVVAQILAGNVFLNGIIGLAQCLLTRNAALLKLSRQESGFTSLFVQSLGEADKEGILKHAVRLCRWKSQQEEFNQVVREEADGIVVWGGEAAVAAYPVDKCRGKVIHYGPRLGIGVVLSGVNLPETLPALAWDIALWEQRACSSPRMIFVEETPEANNLIHEVAEGLSKALHDSARQLIPQPMSLDGKAEVLSIRELAWWTEQAEVFATMNSMDHTILKLQRLPQEIPVGYRTVFLIPFRSPMELKENLKPYRDVLQTAVLAAPSDRWGNAITNLVQAGITQVVASGSAASRFLGLPHEGDFALRRLVNHVGVDLGIGPLTYPERSRQGSEKIADALCQNPG